MLRYEENWEGHQVSMNKAISMMLRYQWYRLHTRWLVEALLIKHHWYRLHTRWLVKTLLIISSVETLLIISKVRNPPPKQKHPKWKREVSTYSLYIDLVKSGWRTRGKVPVPTEKDQRPYQGRKLEAYEFLTYCVALDIKPFSLVWWQSLGFLFLVPKRCFSSGGYSH
jgi:hypothetical protein